MLIRTHRGEYVNSEHVVSYKMEEFIGADHPHNVCALGDNGDWMQLATFDTKEEAIAALDRLAGFVAIYADHPVIYYMTTGDSYQMTTGDSLPNPTGKAQ